MTAASVGRVVRLESHAVHHGSALFTSGADGICGSLPEGADLSRQANGELVPGVADGIERMAPKRDVFAELLGLPTRKATGTGDAGTGDTGGVGGA